MLQQLLELVRKKNIFRWNLKNLEIKLIATILYYASISFRKTRKFLADFERFSHESVRIWYHKMSRVFTTSKKYRRCIAVDVGSWEIVGAMVTEWRTFIDVIKFAREVLETLSFQHFKGKR